MMPWAIKWRSENKLDGKRERLMGGVRYDRPYMFGGYKTMVFRTRDEARHYLKENYGHLAERDDLKREPHGWKMPQVVKVSVSVTECT